MAVQVEFSWGVTPQLPGHWHQTFVCHNFSITIGPNSAAASTKNGDREGQRERAQEIVQNLLRRIGLRERTRFDSRLSSVSEYNPESQTKSVTVIPEPAAVHVMADHVDVLVRDVHGNITVDSRADRVSDAQDFADALAKSTPLRALCDYLLEYYDDPERRLFPIYDMIEEVEKAFGRQLHEAAKQLTNSKEELEHLRDAMKAVKDICDNEPIRTGRHRGRKRQELRDITPDEVRLCESVAETIVERYRGFVEEGGS